MLCEKYKATNYRGSRTESSRSKKPKKIENKKKQENYIMTHRTQPKVHEKQQGALSNTPESAWVVASFFCFVPRVTECCSKNKGRIKKV